MGWIFEGEYAEPAVAEPEHSTRTFSSGRRVLKGPVGADKIALRAGEHILPGAATHEVGRCWSYEFRVLALPEAVSRITVFAIGTAGEVIANTGRNQYPAWACGNTFTVRVGAAPERVAKWIFEAEYAEPPVRKPPQHQPPGRSGGTPPYRGRVIAKKGGSVAHHPACSSARAIDPGRRREFSSILIAEAAGYRMCMQCLPLFFR
jgi:hypothetical protein